MLIRELTREIIEKPHKIVQLDLSKEMLAAILYKVA
jgi:hypothetical protein